MQTLLFYFFWSHITPFCSTPLSPDPSLYSPFFIALRRLKQRQHKEYLFHKFRKEKTKQRKQHRTAHCKLLDLLKCQTAHNNEYDNRHDKDTDQGGDDRCGESVVDGRFLFHIRPTICIRICYISCIAVLSD